MIIDVSCPFLNATTAQLEKRTNTHAIRGGYSGQMKVVISQGQFV